MFLFKREFKLKRNKISGADGLVIERLAALDYLDSDEITEIINEAFYNCDIPEYFRSIYRVLSINPMQINVISI